MTPFAGTDARTPLEQIVRDLVPVSGRVAQIRFCPGEANSMVTITFDGYTDYQLYAGDITLDGVSVSLADLAVASTIRRLSAVLQTDPGGYVIVQKAAFERGVV